MDPSFETERNTATESGTICNIQMSSYVGIPCDFYANFGSLSSLNRCSLQLDPALSTVMLMCGKMRYGL